MCVCASPYLLHEPQIVNNVLSSEVLQCMLLLYKHVSLDSVTLEEKPGQRPLEVAARFSL